MFGRRWMMYYKCVRTVYRMEVRVRLTGRVKESICIPRFFFNIWTIVSIITHESCGLTYVRTFRSLF